MRVEHWTNAAEQGAHAARTILGVAAGEAPSPYAPVPFFWSDQYGLKLQFLGRAGPDDDVRIVHGSKEEHGFVALYGRAGRLRGVFGMARPKLVMGYQRLLAQGVSWDDALAHAVATA
jgi:NADPH-dependent 2,4-dienoyl-CoA reductase/sulfur reductase-like enzyme